MLIHDLRRIAAWLAEDTDNDEAQGAASDLLAAAELLTNPIIVDALQLSRDFKVYGDGRAEHQAAVDEILEQIEV